MEVTRKGRSVRLYRSDLLPVAARCVPIYAGFGGSCIASECETPFDMLPASGGQLLYGASPSCLGRFIAHGDFRLESEPAVNIGSCQGLHRARPRAHVCQSDQRLPGAPQIPPRMQLLFCSISLFQNDRIVNRPGNVSVSGRPATRFIRR